MISMSKEYYLYCHTNKINGKKYFGITCQPPTNRWREGEGYKECPIFYNAVKKQGWDNFKHEILYTSDSKDEICKKEIEMIETYKTNNLEFGYNCSSGGYYGGHLSDETKEKISRYGKGRKKTEEHKRKIGEAQKGEKNHRYGKKNSKEMKEKVTKANILHPSSGAFPKRKVAQYTLDGELIKVWDSMGEIRRALGIRHCNISDCCRGFQKTSGGFVWKYYA